MNTLSQMSLEVTVVSGEEVRLGGGRALGGGAYAVVHTASSAARTHIDEDGDCNGYPYWEEAVQVTMPASSPGLDVEICRTRSSGRVESVAAARVPTEDFTVGPPGHLHCLSYRLFDRSLGPIPHRNGIVNITVKRLDGQGKAPAPPGEGKAPVPAAGKAVDAGASASSGSCCGVAEEVKPTADAPAGVVMGYPVGFSATGLANGKG